MARAQWKRTSSPAAAMRRGIRATALVTVALAATALVVSCKNSSGGSDTSGCGTRGCKLTAPDAGPEDTFGFAIAIEGDVLVVGGMSDETAEDAGAAYIFDWDGSSWVFEQRIEAGDARGGDLFGASVAISGDVILVGAPGEDLDNNAGNGGGNGAVYVFRHDGTTWSQERKIFASDYTASDAFGITVAVDGDVAVIGSYLDDDNGNDSGSVYIYRHSTGTSWPEEQKINPASAAAFDRFGYSVDLEDTVIVVGAYRDDNNGGQSGSAFVFRYGGATWTEEQILLASDGAPGDEFGISVDLSDDAIVVGSHLDDAGEEDSGSAYVFRYSGATWNQEQKLVPADPGAFDSFGIHVTVDDDLVVVGSYRDDDDGVRSGSAYAFRVNGTRWSLEEKLTAADATTGDHFGVSTAADDDTVTIGAYQAGPGNDASGHVYVFEL